MLTAAILTAALLLVLYCPPKVVDRLVAVVERRTAVLERAHEKPAQRPRDPIPADLLLTVQKESEGWAREQATAALYEQFMELGSWDSVREVRGG